MKRARRRTDEAEVERHMERIARDGWHWGPRLRKKYSTLLKKLAHNPKACGGHCCNRCRENDGPTLRERKQDIADKQEGVKP